MKLLILLRELKVVWKWLVVIALLWPAGVMAAGPLPGLWVTPLELDFGPVGVGTTSAPQVVTILNPGSATLTNFAGGAPINPQFTGTQNCAGGVAPGASCTYTFRFSPTATGVFSTTSSTSTNAGPFIIRLRGEGVGARLHVTPLELDFGQVEVGATSAPQMVTIRNVGLAQLTNFAGGAPINPRFTATQNCVSGVAPGASCTYTFYFSPTATGVFSTTSNTSTNAGPFKITLHGQSGVVPPGATMSFTPNPVIQGGISRMELTLSNLNRVSVIDDVSFNMVLPPGVQVAAIPQASVAGCGAATLSASAGANTISFAGGRLLLGVRCRVQVNLTAPNAGEYTISTGLINTSNSGAGVGTSAVLQVIQFKVFLPLVQR
ncbi:MAG: choice-of-anchor D domain-containing protein [Anaerolineae bacterium]|nr:choice-of-anchor D domain-containing protein [Anaerolineae bacterium]